MFWLSRKILHFFHLLFSSSFSNFLKIFKALYSSTQNHLFNEVLLLIISFFLQEQLTKMNGLPIFLKYTFLVENISAFEYLSSDTKIFIIRQMVGKLSKKNKNTAHLFDIYFSLQTEFFTTMLNIELKQGVDFLSKCDVRLE